MSQVSGCKVQKKPVCVMVKGGERWAMPLPDNSRYPRGANWNSASSLITEFCWLSGDLHQWIDPLKHSDEGDYQSKETPWPFHGTLKTIAQIVMLKVA
jgi:hypothetical protein